MSVTVDACVSWTKLPELPQEGDERELAERVLAAVVEHIDRYYVTDEEHESTVAMATMMVWAREWRRRDTPEGVAAFADLAAIRVTAIDPDVREMLVPLWSFA